MGHLTRNKVGHFARRAISLFPKRETAIILFIFLFHAVTNALVVSSHMAPFTGDEAMFMEQSWYFLQAFVDGRHTKLVSISDYHPPLQRLLAVPFYLMFGYSPTVAVMSMLLASLVLIISVYHIGKELHSKDAGLLAAALTVLLPGVFAFSRSFVEEFPLTALVALSLALILKTKHFSHRGYTLAFGASVGLGILCKWSFSLYAIGPFIVYALISVRQAVGESDNPARELLRRGAWLLLAVFLGLVLASWWYLPNLKSVAENFRYIHLDAEDVASAPLKSSRSPRAFLFYAEAFLSGQLGWPMALTTLISCIFLLKGGRKATSFLISWIIIPLLMLIAITLVRVGRHTMPTLPAAALLISMGCMTLQPSWRKVCVPAVMLIALSQFFIISFMGNPAPPYWKHETGLRRADPDNWGTEEIASAITSLLSTRRNVTVMLLPGHLYNHHTIGYLQKVGTFPSFELIDAKHCIDTGYGCGKTYEEYVQMFDRSDVVIIGEVVEDFKSKGSLEEEYSHLLDAWNSSKSEFPYVSERVLPDTSLVKIYTRVPHRSSMNMEGAEREHTIAQGDAN